MQELLDLPKSSEFNELMSRMDIDAVAYKGNNGVQETSQRFATPKTDEEVQEARKSAVYIWSAGVQAYF